MEGMDLELFEAVQRVEPGIQGQGGAVAAELVAVEEGGVLLLQVPAVGQQDGAQVTCARGAVDGVGVAVARQQRQVTAVVQVGMGQHHGVDLVRRDGQALPIAQAQLLVALEQAAIDQQALAVVTHQILGAGDGAGAAQESDVDVHVSRLPGDHR